MKANTCALQRALLQALPSELEYDRRNGTFCGTVTVTNISPHDIAGPLTIVVTDLTPKAALTNADGHHGADPYIRVPLPAGSLLPGGSISVPVVFRKSALWRFAALRYRVKTYVGDFRPKTLHAANRGDSRTPETPTIPPIVTAEPEAPLTSASLPSRMVPGSAAL